MRTFLRAGLTFLLGCTACAAAQAVEVPSAEENEFHFVVLGDAQFHDTIKFNRIIDQAKLLRPSFVIQVGDLIQGYNDDMDDIEAEWVRFKKQVAPLEPVTYFPVPGNHDVYNGSRTPDARLEAIYEDHWGPIVHTFTYKNVQFYLLNSDSTEGQNQIGPEQFAWLDRELRRSRAEHKMAFMHKPPLYMENADALHALFVQHDVSHVFYGHFHHFHYIEKDGVHYTMTNAAANMAGTNIATGSFHHLLQISVRGPEVVTAIINADSVHSRDIASATDNADFFQMYLNLAPRAPVALEELGARRYGLAIPMRNTASRAIRALVFCGSDDNRWTFIPERIEAIDLAPGDQHELVVEAGYAESREPESNPYCTVRVPYQTSTGIWIDHNFRVNAER